MNVYENWIKRALGIGTRASNKLNIYVQWTRKDRLLKQIMHFLYGMDSILEKK